MALTNIEYGSLASSEVLNTNFIYLDNRISDLSNASTSNIASINSNIASINSSVTKMQEDYQNKIDTINKTIENKHFIKESFTDGESGYRIWTDNFCEQWGKSLLGGNYISFLKPFKDTNYNITLGASSVAFAGQIAWPSIYEKQTDKFNAGYQASKGNSGSGIAHWHACGFILVAKEEL